MLVDLSLTDGERSGQVGGLLWRETEEERGQRRVDLEDGLGGTNWSSSLDETMLVSEVDVARVLLSRIDPTVSDGDSFQREVREMRSVEKRVG